MTAGIDANLRFVLDESPVGIAVVARNPRRRLLTNRSLLRMFGAATAEDLFAAPWENTYVDPADLDRISRILDSGGSIENEEVRRRRLDGTEWYALMTSRPGEFEGQKVAYVWHHDISDRKRAEQALIDQKAQLEQQVAARTSALQEQEARFRDFALSSSDWFWESGADHRLTYVSDRLFDLIGLRPGNHLGRTRRDFADEDTDTQKWAEHQAVLDSHQPFRDFCFQVRREDGEIVIASISGRPMFGADGQFLGYRGTGSDVTLQRQAEAARDEALREAERANLAKSQFLATMSHELRTPLNAILGFSEILHQQYFGPLGGPKYKEYAIDIHHSAAHLLELVNDVLDLSAIEKGSIDLDMRPVRICGLIDDCARTVGARILQKNITLDHSPPGDLPQVMADARAIKQVLLNLLSNAVKFTPDGGRISLQAGAADGRVEIVVADTGEGIPPDRLSHIKAPFVAAGPDPYKSSKGWGMGLAIANSLIVLHEGDLMIDSVPGGGTKVTVRLPAIA